MRTSSAAAVLVLAACAQDAPEASAADPDNLIECALGGSAEFARECLVEQRRADEGLILIVLHPDGSFRRFVATNDGMGVAPADGEQGADISLRADGIEVAVGTDCYRFPATIAGDDRS